VIADQRREPADPVAAVGEVADVGRAPAMIRTAPGSRPAASADARTWATNQRIRSGSAELEHGPVRDPAGQLERLGP
jgi:hypothetical protein